MDLIAETCGEELEDGIHWEECPVGEVFIAPCPENQTGEAERKCNEDETWGDVNLNNCVDEEVSDVVDEINHIIGIGANDTNAVENVLSDLEDAIIPESDKSIHPGNMKVVIISVGELAEARSNISGDVNVTDSETQAVINITSHLIDLDNKDSWDQLLEESSSYPQHIINNVDIYARMRSKTLAEEGKQKEEQLANRNILLAMAYVSQNITDDVIFPRPTTLRFRSSYNLNNDWLQDEVIIDKQLLENIQQYFNEHNITSTVTVSATFYRTMHHYLVPYDNENTDGTNSTERLGSGVVSVIIPEELDNEYLLDPPLKMKIHIINNTDYNKTIDVPVCSYYDERNYSWYEDGMTTFCAEDDFNVTCLSNHTTSFGIIIRPDVPLDGVHKTVLTWLTHTFLTLSVACMIATVVVYSAFWKKLRSQHGVLLLNLCVSLICGHVVFMVEAWRDPDDPWTKEETRDNVSCTVIGVLMHFFYLASFCIMLAEGVQILISVTCVFHKKRFRETYGLIAAAWLVSAITVVITIGVLGEDAYVPKATGESCWLKLNADYSGSIWAFVGPMIFIIVDNLIIYGIVQYKSIRSSGLNKSQRERVRDGVWNLMVLCPVLGITWIFGIFTLTNVEPDVTIAFLYLFTIFATLQGVFIFIFHCLLNKKVMTLMASCGKTTILSNSDRSQVHQTESTSRDVHRHDSSEDLPSLLKYVPRSGEYFSINSGYEPDTPVTLHRELVLDRGAPTLYTTFSQQHDTDTVGTGSSLGTGETSGQTRQSLPGYSFKLPVTAKPPSVDWESFACDNIDYFYDNAGYVGDSTITYF